MLLKDPGSRRLGQNHPIFAGAICISTGSTAVSPPSDDDTRLYIIIKRQEGNVEGTLAALFSALKKLHLSCHWDWNFTGDDRPLPGTEANAPAFTEEELATLIHNRQEYSRGELFYLAIATTMAPRRIELSRIKKKDMSINQDSPLTGEKETSVYIRTAKKGPPRWHLIPPEILPVILDYKPKGLTAGALSAMIHRIILKGMGEPMPGYGWHSFRRSLMTLGTESLAVAGEDLTLWAQYMRWSKTAIGASFFGSLMAGHYRRPEILDKGDIFSLDRTIIKLHPVLKYWRE